MSNIYVLLCDCPSAHPNYPTAFGPLTWAEAKQVQEDHFQRSEKYHEILRLEFPYMYFERRRTG